MKTTEAVKYHTQMLLAAKLSHRAGFREIPETAADGWICGSRDGIKWSTIPNGEALVERRAENDTPVWTVVRVDDVVTIHVYRDSYQEEAEFWAACVVLR